MDLKLDAWLVGLVRVKRLDDGSVWWVSLATADQLVADKVAVLH